MKVWIVEIHTSTGPSSPSDFLGTEVFLREDDAKRFAQELEFTEALWGGEHYPVEVYERKVR